MGRWVGACVGAGERVVDGFLFDEEWEDLEGDEARRGSLVVVAGGQPVSCSCTSRAMTWTPTTRVGGDAPAVAGWLAVAAAPVVAGWLWRPFFVAAERGGPREALCLPHLPRLPCQACPPAPRRPPAPRPHPARLPRRHRPPPQVALYRSLLPRALAELPGGGLGGGSILEVTDQEQHFRAQLVLAHRVSPRSGGAHQGRAARGERCGRRPALLPACARAAVGVWAACRPPPAANRRSTANRRRTGTRGSTPRASSCWGRCPPRRPRRPRLRRRPRSRRRSRRRRRRR